MEDSAHAFLVLAHTDEKMFGRLVDRLCEVGPVYVHIDLKSDISTWSIKRSNLIFLENRVRVYWGHWSAVEAEVRLLEEALKDSNIQRLTLLSGSHYPLISAKELAIKAKGAGNVIAARPAPDQPGGVRPSSEYERRYLPSNSPNGIWSKLTNGFTNRIFYAGRPLRWERLAGSSGMRAGSAYWSLEREAAQYCRDRIRAEDGLIKFFKKIVCPDEKVFQTVFAEFDPSEHSDGTTYVKWARNPNPEILTSRDLELVRNQSDFWFARKFSSVRDQNLLDWIDSVQR